MAKPQQRQRDQPSPEHIAYSVWMLPSISGIVKPVESLFASYRCPRCGGILAPDRGMVAWHECAGGCICITGDWLYTAAWALRAGWNGKGQEPWGTADEMPLA